MYEEPVMEEFLTKHGFTRVRCMVDWGQAVKEKYREMLDGCRDTVADARCPMACGLVEALAVDGVRAAAIEPILIHCAREISCREDLGSGGENHHHAVCFPGRYGKFPGACQHTVHSMEQALKGNWGRGLRESSSMQVPFRLAFFAGVEEKVQSLTGKEEIEAYMKSGRWREVRLVEMLYCHRGCHNGDGVMMDET